MQVDSSGVSLTWVRLLQPCVGLLACHVCNPFVSQAVWMSSLLNACEIVFLISGRRIESFKSLVHDESWAWPASSLVLVGLDLCAFYSVCVFNLSRALR